MQDLITKISPIFVIFAIGYVLKRLGFLKQQHAELFLKLIMYLALPALIIPSFAAIPLTTNLVPIPIFAAVIIIVTLLIAVITAHFLTLPKQTKGTFILAASIMNLSLVLSFFQAAFGQEALAYFLLLVIGHDIMLFTLLYYLACYYGNQEHEFSHHKAFKKLLLLPPLWAVVIGLMLNVTKTPVPAIITPTLTILGNLFTPLLMLALGTVFHIPAKFSLKLLLPIIIRIVGGLSIGLLLTKFFNLEGFVRATIILGSAAPVGFNTLVFATLEKLDKKLAAQIISTGLIIGGVVILILLYFLAPAL